MDMYTCIIETYHISFGNFLTKIMEYITLLKILFRYFIIFCNVLYLFFLKSEMFYIIYELKNTHTFLFIKYSWWIPTSPYLQCRGYGY